MTRPRQANQERVSIAKAMIQEFPDHGTRTIARALAEKYPQLFPNIESARTCIRAIQGQKGERDRNLATMPRKARKPGYRLTMPQSRARDIKPHVLAGNREMLVISDLHIPYHDQRAVELAVEKGIRDGCDTVVLLGDIMDCYQVSRWTRDPGMPSIPEELATVKEFLAMLRERFPKAEIIWKEGNHEERWKHFLFNNAPQLAGLESVGLYANTGCKEQGAIVVDERRPIDAGNLRMYHGHELPKGLTNPVNQARGQFLRALSNMVCGHGHRTSNHVEASDQGLLFGNWSLGCLCHLKPDFAPVNKWNHGFARISLSRSKKFHVQNYIIHEGEILGTNEN